MTEFEKDIYNTHLKISRTVKDKPYKKRLNFDDLEEEKKIIVQKLARFLGQYPSINIENYFKAPHKVYPDDSHYPLDFYITSKAKKCYSTYMKSLELSDPDTSENLKKLQENLAFVYKYCSEHDISLEEYQDYTPENLPVFIDHLKNHHISFYTLHALTFTKISVESNILDFIFGDFYITFQKTRNKFYASKKMKEFSKQAIIKINNKLKNKII